MKRVIAMLTVAGVVNATPAPAQLIDAFVVQVETPAQVVALDEALCNQFGYRPQVPDPAAAGQVDQAGNVVMIPNPEPCSAFANRKLIEWLADVVKRNNKTVAADIAAYARAREQELSQSMGSIKITPLLDVSTAGTVASGTAP